MTAYTGTIVLPQTKEEMIVDITGEVAREIERSGVQTGICLVFVPGSTGALSVLEYEPGLAEDLPAAIRRLFPRDIEYKHHIRWHDGNGHSHVRASFLGPDISIPVLGGKPKLGQWQQVIFVEFDVKPRKRELTVQVVGE
ncbi:MAG: secondary thiamine-phosphate synthase enzyme YjbQ [Thermoplasmata archaeon]|nr:secondary thiamine-phosphate synthase enzyme YjbQ [Thermoplasmata archaeon]